MVDVSKAVEQMTDDELAELVKLAELMDEAKREQDRRASGRAAGDAVSVPTARARYTTSVPCPCCGRNDAVLTTKTIYKDAELREVSGGAAACACGCWYDTTTGERVAIGKKFTY